MAFEPSRELIVADLDRFEGPAWFAPAEVDEETFRARRVRDRETI